MSSATSKCSSDEFRFRDVLPFTPQGRFVFTVSFLAALNSMILGYDISIMSGANIFIVKHFKLTVKEEEFETGLLNLAAVPGALLLGAVAENFGRRKAVLCNGFLMLIGATSMALSRSLLQLCLGRVITGVAVGGAACVVPLYLAEVAPRHVRGFLVSLSETATNIGVFFGFLMGYLAADLPEAYSWRLMLACGGLPALFLLCTTRYLPESPRFLYITGCHEEARDVISQSSSKPAMAAEFMADMQQSVAVSKDSGWADVICPSRNHRAILGIAITVAVGAQASGIEAAMYYTPTVFQKAGINSVHTQLRLTMLMGLLKLIVTIIAGAYMDIAGRRSLIISGCFLIAMSHSIISYGLTSEASAVAVLGQFAFICSFAISLGPGCWIMLPELLPLRLRSKAMALCTGLNRLTSSLIVMFFLSLSRVLTPSGLFLCLACVNVAFGAVFYFILPETKGRTLEEIERQVTGTAEGSEAVYGACKADSESEDPKTA